MISLKSKRVVILGGAGFIGSNLSYRLVKEGASVKIFTRAGRAIKNVSKILNDVELVYGDFMDEVALKKATADADYIIHLISTTFPGTSIDSGVYDIYSNLIPTIRLLEICKSSKGGRLIYASSGGTIYGEPKEQLITEDHPLNPKSMYGQSKKVIESYMNFFVKNSDVNIQTLRISNPFGPYQNPYGAQGVVATAFRCALNNSVFNVFGKGLTVRDYIFVDDVVEAMISSMKADKSHLVNISSGVGRSVLEVVESIQKISGREIKTKFIDQREGDVEVSILSNEKAAKVYNWRPKTNFEEGLLKTWQWISSEISIIG